MKYNYSIMPLSIDHIDELCADIKAQVDAGISSCAVFSMQLEAKGNPPILNKPEEWCEIYDTFKKRLDEMGVASGILIQRSFFHPPTETPFQNYVNLSDGQEVNHYCPSDVAYQEYTKNTMKILAEHNPAVIFLDDDFRLLTNGGGRRYGCCCPLHLAEFNKRAGTNYSQEELSQILKSEENPELSQIFMDVQKDSLLIAARAMREGVDSVNPELPIVYCTVGGEFAGEISEILSGDKNPVICRLNCGNYSQPGTHLVFPMLRAAMQIAATKDTIDVYLAETDTCPHNRYSKSAQSLHAHFTGCILEGVKGAKHWITRMSAYEPSSGLAYRKILAKHSGFYEKLMEIVPTLSSVGCKIPLANKISFSFSGNVQGWEPNQEAWASGVLEQLGLPLYFSRQDGGATFLDGTRDGFFTDDEIRKMLSGTLFLSADAAKNLISRGFGKYLGVNIRPWNGKTADVELIGKNRIALQNSAEEIVPLSGDVKTLSYVAHRAENNRDTEPLFPAVTEYKNALGGTVFTFCGNPFATGYWASGYSFLNETRKAQLAEMLKSTHNLPAYYPGDEPTYLRVANMPDEKLFCGLFNVALDIAEELSLVIFRDVKKISRLMPNGEFCEISFTKNGDTYTLDTFANPLDPVILVIE